MMKRLYAVLALVCQLLVVQGQECPGGLGDNLFTEGDFGSGTSFSLDVDPELAPGYRYNRFGPPMDGEYMITNDFNKWNNVFGTWLRPKDNSNDPNGYMMVVNASFDPGLFYEETVEGLCDNTKYEFSADIMNLIRNGVNDHSDPNVDFLIDDIRVLGTGNISKNERWNTYSFSFDTEPGQTSVRLSLRNNAPGGIGNDLALDNISFRACGPRSEVSLINGDQIICEEDLPVELVALIEDVEDQNRLYRWEVQPEGQLNWEVIPGQEESRLIYTDQKIDSRTIFRFSTAASIESFANEKCRFFSETLSVYVSQRSYERFDTICGGASIDLNGTTIIEPGVYMESLTSRLGCDSIVTIFLDTVKREVLQSDISSLDPGCFGESTGIVTASNVIGGYPPYHLNINDKEYDGLIADDLVEGNYDVFIEDRFDCFALRNVVLVDPPQFTLDLGPDLALLLGEEIIVQATANQNVMDISWSEPLSEFNGMLTFDFLPIRDGTFEGSAISDDGCEATDTVNFTLDTDVSIYIPNIFSPNADFINDTYFISPFGKSLGNISVFSIYDRWGSEIWSYSEASPQWDGKDRSNRDVLSGVYPYVMKGSLINGDPIQAKGTLVVIR